MENQLLYIARTKKYSQTSTKGHLPKLIVVEPSQGFVKLGKLLLQSGKKGKTFCINILGNSNWWNYLPEELYSSDLSEVNTFGTHINVFVVKRCCSKEVSFFYKGGCCSREVPLRKICCNVILHNSNYDNPNWNKNWEVNTQLQKKPLSGALPFQSKKAVKVFWARHQLVVGLKPMTCRH